MLSDKVPDRGQVTPPQKPLPADPLKVYAVAGGVLGILAVCVVRNLLGLPDLLSPVALQFTLGGLAFTCGLQDLLLGAIVGSASGVHFGKKAWERQDQKRFRDHSSQHAPTPGRTVTEE